MVIMAMTAMMVAPSYFSAVSVSLDDEGKRLAQAMRLASEEAVLSGELFRVRFRQHSYQFQSAGRNGAWQTLQQRPYQPYRLAQGFQFVEVKPAIPLTEQTQPDITDAKKNNANKKAQEAVLADVLLRPEGIGQIANIVLSAEPDNGHQLTVTVRPGPGGIRIKQDDKRP